MVPFDIIPPFYASYVTLVVGSDEVEVEDTIKEPGL